MKKEARFIQLIDVQKSLYALDEEGKVWQYVEDKSSDGYMWMPLSSKRYEEPSPEPDRSVGF
jgi:hypothetical protein